MHGHDEQEIYRIKKGLDCGERSIGIEREADFAPVATHKGQRAPHATHVLRLHVNRNRIRARLGKWCDKNRWPANHQLDIKRQPRVFTHG